VARPLRLQILVVAAILAVVVLGAIFYASRLTYREELAHLEDETRAMTAVVVAYVDRNLEAADAVALTAARHPAVQELRAGAASEVLMPLVSSGETVLRNAVLADRSGRPVAWAVPPESGVEGQLPDAWLSGVAASGRPATSPLLGSAEAGAHVIVLAYPIVGPSADVVGVLGLIVHLESLETVLRSIPMPPESVITISDARSVVVARSLDSARFVGRAVEEAPAVPLAPEAVPPTVVRTGLDGIERVYGNAVVARGPWVASVGIPTAVAAGRTTPIYIRNLAIAAAALLVVLGLLLYFTRRGLKALGDVTRTAERVARGDLSPLEPRDLGSVELNQLHSSLAGMINSLRGAQEAVATQVAEERRVREEKESLQRQLIRQERLAAIGVLVSGVAHELNNPLQAILGFAELLAMQDDLPEPVRHDLSLIQRESTRASAIIRNLQRFGRQTSEPSPVRLSDVVASVLELRQRKLEALGIALEIEDQSDAFVPAVFTELQQVVLNFLINAEQAVATLDEPRRRVKVRTSDGRNTARLEVEDYGDGVPQADEAKLFQPFFTTKPVGEGTGLGLSVSYGIITSHGGEIGYRRARQGGAIFYFELPIQ
jgi:signal transduction histidine kinase